MNPKVVIAALVIIVIALVILACWRARRRALRVEKPRDWREDWCTFDCWAEDGQQGPCKDCAGRRAARR